MTKYTSQCKHPSGEEHVTHFFNVSDRKVFDWAACDCDESSDSSLSQVD